MNIKQYKRERRNAGIILALTCYYLVWIADGVSPIQIIVN